MQHLISLINNHVLETLESQKSRTIHEINQPTRGSNEEITALLEQWNLLTKRATTIDDTRTKHGTVAKASGLVEDLSSKLSVGADDENQRLSTISLTLPHESRVATDSSKLLSLAHEL
jgi:uncharacterized protein YoxC